MIAVHHWAMFGTAGASASLKSIPHRNRIFSASNNVIDDQSSELSSTCYVEQHTAATQSVVVSNSTPVIAIDPP